MIQPKTPMILGISTNFTSTTTQRVLLQALVDMKVQTGGRYPGSSSKLSSDLSSDFESQASSHVTSSTEYEFEDYWCDIYTRSIDGTLEFQEQYRL